MRWVSSYSLLKSEDRGGGRGTSRPVRLGVLTHAHRNTYLASVRDTHAHTDTKQGVGGGGGGKE